MKTKTSTKLSRKRSTIMFSKYTKKTMKSTGLMIIILLTIFLAGCSGNATLPWDDGGDSGDGGSGTLIVANPTFSMAAGVYTAAQTVAISSATADVTIYYTTNGNTPTTNDTEYASAISINTSLTLQALAVKAGMTNSSVISASFNIGEFLGTESGATIALTNYTGTNAVVNVPDTVNGKTVVTIGQTNGMPFIVNSTTLKSIIIPDSVTNICKMAFNSNFELTNVIIGNGVISIGSETFSWNIATVNVTLGNSLQFIGFGAFAEVTLANITLPTSLLSIGGSCFSGNSFISITIPAGVTNIGSQAFMFCGLLTNVTVLATTPPTLGGNAFANNGTGRKINVPAASEVIYETAVDWSTYATVIDAIQE